MSSFKTFCKCFFSPTLYMVYRGHNYSEAYQPDKWEKIGDFSISTISFFWKFSAYVTPLLAIFIYRQGYMNVESAMTLTKLLFWISQVFGASYCLRSYGRISNPQYIDFLEKLSKAETPEGTADIKMYDFDFEAWPVDFHLPVRTSSTEPDKCSRSTLSTLISSPCSIVGYLVLHSVGIRMIYPGSITLLNSVIWGSLIDGRRALIVEQRGKRFKLKTPEGNFVDTMFIDRRNNGTKSMETAPTTFVGVKSGSYLVLCSEGNAGFYENGIMETPMSAGFSVLGWNHPGFGGSTGMPYIMEEESAINTVMEFAIQKLGFEPDYIIPYGWSIGGYTSSWTTANYPNVKAIVVDATFDDVLPLAINQMPSFLESIVRATIRSYADLNVSRQILDYQGPIRMVRRSEDEIIAIRFGDIASNRGNYLLRKILKRRYPQLINDEVLTEWLSLTGFEQRSFEDTKNVNNLLCHGIIESYVYDHGPTFPFVDLGRDVDEDIKEQLTIYLAGSYMVDYKSTHCKALPSSLFLGLIGDLL